MSDMFAPRLINNYVWDKLKASTVSTYGYGNRFPFFPVFDNTSTAATWENKVYVVYDEMARFQINPFYPIKREHLLYSLRGPMDKILDWRTFIVHELDRGDDAGKDINDWAGLNDFDTKVFLHDVRVHQLEFNRDAARRAATSNTPYYAAELIIDYRYHISD
jgi:hypothetical protein